MARQGTMINSKIRRAAFMAGTSPLQKVEQKRNGTLGKLSVSHGFRAGLDFFHQFGALPLAFLLQLQQSFDHSLTVFFGPILVELLLAFQAVDFKLKTYDRLELRVDVDPRRVGHLPRSGK